MKKLTDEDVRDLSDKELTEKVELEVRYAGLSAAHTVHDYNCTALYEEAVRRGKEELYNRGYKQAEAGI